MKEASSVKKRKLPDFIIQGAKRERLATELFQMGAADSMEEARLAARGLFFVLLSEC